MNIKKGIVILFLISCSRPLKKPFIIISKYPYENGSDFCRYYYQDANGGTNDFNDNKNKYNVGDTLK